MNEKRALKNQHIGLSHHEKRSIAWKIFIVMLIFFVVIMFGGLFHYISGITDPKLSIWFMAIVFTSLGMFAIGYMIRDKLPKKMGLKCKRFYYMGQEFGFWHWSRAQILIADIFLVSTSAALYGWAAAHTIPLLVSGITWTTIVPFLYIPMFYVFFWIEFLAEGGLILITVVALVYELRTWVINKRADFCYFEGVRGFSKGMDYDCGPDDIDCKLDNVFK